MQEEIASANRTVEVTVMFDPQVMLVSADTAPAWMIVLFFAFWAGLPQIVRMLLRGDQ
jgi:hypothetical protein